MKIIKMKKANRAKIESLIFEEEGIEGGQYWVELKKGFCFRDEGTHCFGEDTQMKVMESMWDVKACNCSHYCGKGV